MLITCPACQGHNRVDPAHAAPGLGCRKCGAELPAEALWPEPAARRLVPAILVLALLFALGAALHALSAFGLWGASSLPRLRVFAQLSTILAGCGVAATAGLLLHRPWGWWAGCVFTGVSAALNLKFAVPLLQALNYDHPEAGAALRRIGLVYGLPLLVQLALAVMLSLRSVRLAVGVADKPLPTRRRPVAAVRRRP